MTVVSGYFVCGWKKNIKVGKLIFDKVLRFTANGSSLTSTKQNMCDTLRTFQLVFLFCSLCHVFIVNALVQVTTEKFRETVENNKYVIVLFCKFYQFLPPVRYWGRKITHTQSIITLCNCEVEDVILFLMRCTSVTHVLFRGCKRRREYIFSMS
jgi:hypothetical protein